MTRSVPTTQSSWSEHLFSEPPVDSMHCVCLSVLQEQIRHVRVTASEIQKLTPQLLSAVDMASGQGDSSATTEHLNLLSQEWATKVSHILHCVCVLFEGSMFSFLFKCSHFRSFMFLEFAFTL